MVAQDRGSSRWGMSTARFMRILLNLLEAVRRGISRKALLEGFLDDLELEKDRSADFVILVEGYHEVATDTMLDISIRRVVGDMHEDSLRQLQKGFRHRTQGSVMLRDVLLGHQSLDFINTAFASDYYGGEFRELHGKNPIWLSAIALPSAQAGVPERALFAIWLSKSEGGHVNLPSGGEQEWSLMKALPGIHALLEHELSSLADMVEQQRRELIAELAPRAIHHEFGTNIGLMSDHLNRALDFLPGAEGFGSDPNLLEVLRELAALRKQLDRSKVIAEAFTNLEKRNPGDSIMLDDLINEALAILDPLFTRNNIELIKEIENGILLQTHSALVQHVVLNVLHNAVEAIEDEWNENHDKQDKDEEPPRRHIRVRATFLPKNDVVEILIANDGPALPTHLSLSIFEKGVTTRRHGHGRGHGLYICRLVASLLNGEFDLCPPGQARSQGNVCFRLTFPSKLREREREDMGKARITMGS